MATNRMTTQQLRDKIDWEGGIASTLNYGLRPDEIADPKLAALWTEARQISEELDSVIAEIGAALKAA